MKFKPEHYATLKDSLSKVIDKPDLQRGDKSEQRYLWDLLWASKWTQEYRDQWEGYNDAHTETAIRAAVKELTAKIDPLTKEEQADIKKRFKKWLNYEPKITKEDVTPVKIKEYVTDVLSSQYISKQDIIQQFLLNEYDWDEKEDVL